MLNKKTTDYASITATIVPDPQDENPEAGEEFFCGPEAFCFDNVGNVFVLDTYGKKVIVVSCSNGITKDIIELPDSCFITDIAVSSNTVYLLDESKNEIISITENHVTSIPLPLFESDDPEEHLANQVIGPHVQEIYCDDNVLKVNAGEYGTYLLQDNGFFLCDPMYTVFETDNLLQIRKGDNC